MTASGRPLSGFARPGTGSRPGSSGNLSSAFQGARPGTSRPVTASGRFVRLGTASIVAQGGVFVDVDRLDLRKYAQRPALAKVLCDYILYHDHNVNKTLELCAEATRACELRALWFSKMTHTPTLSLSLSLSLSHFLSFPPSCCSFLVPFLLLFIRCVGW